MTENELLDLYKTLAYLPNDAEGNPLTPFGNFCAGYEAHAELADKQIAELISDIETYVKISGDQATEIVELQAQINELREALICIDEDLVNPVYYRLVKEALDKTAPQCLQEHDNEVIEVKCKTHPDAPHGFNRNESHSAGRYVCDCEFWKEPMKGKQNEP